MGMMPGELGKMSQSIDPAEAEKRVKTTQAIIFSMTPEERSKPEILNMSRKKRISRGCGQDLNQINLFIKQFDQMKKMMNKMTKMQGMGAMSAPGGSRGMKRRGFKRRRR